MKQSNETYENKGVVVGVNNGNIYNGMNYSEVKCLCLELIKDEINKAKQTALETAKQRNESLMEQVFEKISLLKITPDMLKKAFEDPAIQMDFLEAEKSYIKYGTDELCSLLSDILEKRIQENGHTLLQIALGESIKTAPLLLQTQMNTLALSFIITQTISLSVNSHEKFKQYLKNAIVPIYNSGVSESNSEFQHLTYSRCATITAFSSSIVSALGETYSGLFSKGFSREAIPDVNGKSLYEKYPNLFIPCLNDPSKLQINSINDEKLTEKLETFDIDDGSKEKFLSLAKHNKMTEDEIKGKIIELCPEMEEIIKYWDKTSIANLNLSSVGIVIGALTVSKTTKLNYNLHIWIK